MATMEMHEERVSRGIALLNEKLGPSWEDEIDLRSLDLESERCCVFGQLFGTFHDGAIAMLGPRDDLYDVAIEHGFYARGMETDGVESEEGALANYAQLTQAWRRALTPTVRVSIKKAALALLGVW